MDFRSFQLLVNLIVYTLGEVFHAHGCLLATALFAHRNKSLSGFFLAHDNHIRHAFQLVVANLTANLLVAVVHIGAHSLCVEVLGNTLCVVIILLGNRQNSHLVRCEP